MRKPITFVNLVLLAVGVWLAVSARADWQRNHARYQQFAASVAPLPAVSRPSAPAAGAPVPLAVAYADLANRNLFSPDRNNFEPVKEKRPAPPVPTVLGTMNLASGMVAIVSEKRGEGYRRAKVGDEIGGYKVTAIDEHLVTLEFDGEQTKVDVYESAASVAGAPAAPVYSPPSSPQIISTTAPPPVTNVANSAAPQPNVPVQSPAPQQGAGLRSSKYPADTSASCVVENGRKKCSRPSMFGRDTWYEDLFPGEK